MTACFELFPVGSNEPKSLNEIDKELCRVLGREVHPERYVLGWVDTIGFFIACYNDIDQAIWRAQEWQVLCLNNPKSSTEAKLNAIYGFEYNAMIGKHLKKNYTCKAWAER